MPDYNYDWGSYKSRQRKCKRGDHSECERGLCPVADEQWRRYQHMAERGALLDELDQRGLDPREYLDDYVAEAAVIEPNRLHRIKARVEADRLVRKVKRG